MIFRLRIISILTILFTIVPVGVAEDGGLFSEPGVGTRAQGMADAFVAVADDAYAMTANPAGLAMMDRASIVFEYSDLFGLGLAKQSYFGGVFPTRWGTHGLFYRGLRYSFDPFPESANEATLGYSYGRAWGPIALGTTLKYHDFTSDFEQGTASGISLDLGARYQLTTRWALGGSIQNIYSTLKYGTGTTEDIPTTWRFGAAYRISDKWLTSAEFQGVSDNAFNNFRLGTEYWIMRPSVRKTQNPANANSSSIFEREVANSSGYQVAFAVRAGVEKELSGPARTSPTLGTTLGYGSARFDYAYVFSNQGLGSTHRYSLTYDFRPWGNTPVDEPAAPAQKAQPAPVTPSAPAAAITAARRVAVLDFANGTGNSELDWLQPGFADIVARQLNADGVALVDRARLTGTSTLSGPEFLTLSRREGAGFVVRGLFVRTSQSQVVLNARVIDVATGATVDNVEVEGPEGQIFALGNSLAAKIAALTKARVR